MRIRTLAGVAVASTAAAAAIVGGAAYATADESEPTVRIVTEREGVQPAQQQAQPDEDCPEKNGGAAAPQESGL